MFSRQASKTSSYHINKLGDREAKFDNNHIADIPHGSGPLIVTDEEFFKEFVLCMCMDPTVW